MDAGVITGMSQGNGEGGIGESLYAELCEVATTPQGVDAIDALRAAGGIMGRAVLRAFVSDSELARYAPGSVIFVEQVSGHTKYGLEALLVCSEQQGIGGHPETGWMDNLPEFEESRRDLRELVDATETRLVPSLRRDGLSWLEACALLAPVAVRLISDVRSVIPIRFAKALVASSYISASKTVPGVRM